MRRLRGIIVTLVAFAMNCAHAATPVAAGVERNVIYGMYSGLALLLDVHRPAKPNGFGVVFVAGSGFQASPDYGAKPIKETQIDLWGPPLTTAGYTVFAINHRGAPRFHYPGAIDDVQRAIRFVRANAKNFGIDAARLGGLGGSSGGNLIGLAAMRAAPGIDGDADAVNRESAALQAIVLRAAVSDLRGLVSSQGTGYVVSYMEAALSDAPAVKALYDAASPVAQVSAKAPPTLLIHGDADKLIFYRQSTDMESALRKAGVAVKLITVPGGEHGADFGAGGKAHPEWPDYHAETVAWFDRHLRGKDPLP
jgi:acetyl esterase/lipase